MYCHRNIDDTYVTSSRLLPGFFRAESFLISSSGRITRFTPRPEFQSFPSPLKYEHVSEHTKRPNGPFGNTDIGPKRLLRNRPSLVAKWRLTLFANGFSVIRCQEKIRNFREELRDLHENGWALFGLWRSVTAQGQIAEAQEIRKRFDRAWKDADVTLSTSVF